MCQLKPLPCSILKLKSKTQFISVPDKTGIKFRQKFLRSRRNVLYLKHLMNFWQNRKQRNRHFDQTHSVEVGKGLKFPPLNDIGIHYLQLIAVKAHKRVVNWP